MGYKVSVNPFVLFHKQQVQQFIHLAILHSICHPSPSPLLSFLHACFWLRTSLNCSLKLVFKLILAVSAQSMVAHTAHYCPVNSYAVLFRISLFSFLQLPSIWRLKDVCQHSSKHRTPKQHNKTGQPKADTCVCVFVCACVHGHLCVFVMFCMKMFANFRTFCTLVYYWFV